jgi:putative transposase
LGSFSTRFFSLNRRKAKLAVAKVHSKIKRIREDFLHKLSRKRVDQNIVRIADKGTQYHDKYQKQRLALIDVGNQLYCS